MDLGLTGKVAMITGSGSGIGRATAVAFAGEGAKVVVSDIDVAGGEQTVRTIVDIGGEATFIQCDVSKSADVQALVKGTVAKYGSLDCAFNNAGIEGIVALTPEYPEDEWDRVINVNLKGVWLCLKYELEQMIKQGSGAIVNTSSIAGLIGQAGFSAYCASKGGVTQLTRTVALEYAKSGIRVNAVCPAGVETPLTQRIGKYYETHADLLNLLASPIPRMAQPEEIARNVVWLCSDVNGYVTGTLMTIDGGFTAQ